MASENENEKRETLADIVAEIRAYGAQPPPRLMWLDIADRIEIVAKQDELLMLLLMLYAVEDYEESWATNEYKWCVRKGCERIGIEYQPTGRLLQDRIGEKISKMEGEKNGKSE